MSRKVLGCSPDMAARIVNLLMVDIGIRLEPRQIVKAEPPATEPIKLHRNTKVTPDVATWIHAHHELTPTEIVHQVRELFGISITANLVYKIWNRAKA